MKLIDKSALVAEIERLRKNQRLDDRHGQGVLDGLHAIERFIDTLEVSEVDIDYIRDELDKVVKINKPSGDFGWGTLYNIATHFFELGLKVNQKGE